MKNPLLALLAVLALGPIALPAQAVPVFKEIVFLIDVSGTIDGSADGSDGEFFTMKTGIANALRDPDVQAAIQSVGGVAATAVFWGAPTLGGVPTAVERVAVPWTLLSDAASINAFADNLAAADRVLATEPLDPNDPNSPMIRIIGGRTSVASALEFATGLFGANEFTGAPTVNLLGDGTENFDLMPGTPTPWELLTIPLSGGSLGFPIEPQWGAVQQALADATAAGVTVNGVPIRPQLFTPPTNANEQQETRDATRLSQLLFDSVLFDPPLSPEDEAAVLAALVAYEESVIAALGLSQAELTYHEWFYRVWATNGFVEIAEGIDDVQRATTLKLLTEIPEPGTALLLGLSVAALLTLRRARSD